MTLNWPSRIMMGLRGWNPASSGLLLYIGLSRAAEEGVDLLTSSLSLGYRY